MDFDTFLRIAFLQNEHLCATVFVGEIPKIHHLGSSS